MVTYASDTGEHYDDNDMRLQNCEGDYSAVYRNVAPGEQLNTTVHVSFLLQLTVLTSSILRCLQPVMHLQ